MKLQFLEKSNLPYTILFVISIIPLLFYPIILLANIMSLAGYRTGNEPFLAIFLTYFFLFFSSLYPLTFLYSLLMIKKKNLIISFLPIFHVVIIFILYFLSIKFGDRLLKDFSAC